MIAIERRAVKNDSKFDSNCRSFFTPPGHVADSFLMNIYEALFTCAEEEYNLKGLNMMLEVSVNDAD